MARLEVFNIITQWLHHLETDQGMMDRMEVVYRTRYELSEQESLVEAGRCCVECDCSGGCEREEERGGGEAALSQFSYQCGCVEESYTFQGRRLGRSRRTRCDGATITTDYRQGARHGFSLTVSRAGRLERVGWWSHGRRAGTWWTAVPGGAWLVTNTNTNLAIFLYPDLETALLGNINTQDWTAEEELAVCEVTSLSVEAGILLPGLSKTEGNIPANKGLTESVLSQLNTRDPYESKVVEVRQSLIPGAGQGLFMRRGVEGGVVVAYFAGVVVEGARCADSQYSISWLAGAGLDIPPDMRESYCSTLAHKACHSFAPNCEYSWAVHPRFGQIRAIVSLRRLEAGEEVLTDYKYSYSKAPQWYRDDLTNFLINNFNMESEDIAEYIKRMENDRKCA